MEEETSPSPSPSPSPFAMMLSQHHHQNTTTKSAVENSSSVKSLTVKISSTTTSFAKNNNNNNSIESSSPYNSPSLVSPPSSAFVSALQSPYISPRATTPPPPPPPTTNLNLNPTSPPPPVSYCGSQFSDDIPSSSYTPPLEEEEKESTSFFKTYDDYSDDHPTKLHKFMTTTCTTTSDPPAPPRISFSFQTIPRISFSAKGGGGGGVSTIISPPAANNNTNNATTKLRSCDVYIGFHGHNPNLLRFCKWLKSDLELQGIACFVSDRSKYSDHQNHEITDRVISSVTYGVVVVTTCSLFNHLTMEEMRFFAQKKNLIPVFFDTDLNEIMGLLNRNNSIIDKECREAIINGLLMKGGCSAPEFNNLEANEGNWRSCVSKIAGSLRNKLGRKSVVVDNKEVDDEGLFEEIPFPRNRFFVGREKELMEIETAFFGSCLLEQAVIIRGGEAASGQSEEGFADEESDVAAATTTTTTRGGLGGGGGRYINLELGKCKEPTLEAWVEPVIGRNSSYNKRPKYKKSKSSVICINGVPGIGKTELALEFAYRYSQRYKMVLWVGGEARYFRQNILNLSLNLGLDVSADAEKDIRGRIRSFEEQEVEAFKRVKRELFRDMPYLLIIDNLETEREWWEGKDLHDLIPRNTGGTHIIVTTRLSKVMNFDMVQLPPFPLSDAMILIRGRRKKDYPADEVEFLRKFDEKLGRLTFGLWVIGSLLSELAISPSALFEAIINQVPLDEGGSICSSYGGSNTEDDEIFRNNPFLMKVLGFCLVVLQQTSGRGRGNPLALRMFLVGAWFAPSAVSANLLATSAKNIPDARNRFKKKWTKCLSLTLRCCLAHQNWNWKSEEDAALVLIRMGLARRCNNRQAGCWIQFHPIAQLFAKKRKEGLAAAKATVEGVRKSGNPLLNSDHLWASAFIVFGFKSEPPLVQLKAIDIVLFIKRTALPLAVRAFAKFSRCTSALELLKVCTNVLEEVEKSFVSQIQDWCHGSLCSWKKKLQSNQRVDEYLWQDVTLLKATLLETRAKLLLRGGHFDNGEELCRTCISIRTVMLGHNHTQTLAAQETLAKLVRMRSKI